MRRKKLAEPGMTAAAIMGMLWLGLFPLWQDLSYAHITRAKWIGALVLCGATVLLGAGMMIWLAAKKRLRQELRVHPAQLAALGYFVWVALSACFGSWAWHTNAQGQLTVVVGAIRYEGLLTQLCYGLIFLTMSLFPPKEKYVLAAASATLIIFGLVVALQYTGMNVLGLFPAGRSIFTNYEFQGTIGNIDMVSGYLCLVTPLMLGTFVVREKGGWHLLAAGAAGAAILWCIEVQSGLIALLMLCGLLLLLMLRFPAYRVRGCVVLAAVMAGLALRGMLFLPWLDSDAPRTVQPVLFTMTPKALIGVLGVAVLLVLTAVFRRHPGKAMPVRGIICLVLAAVILVLGVVIYAPVPQTAGGLYELHEVLNGRPQDQFGSWRLGVWRHSLDMSKDQLLFGSGPDTYYHAMFNHLQLVGATLGENVDNPHNEYVAILCNNGLPALVLYGLLLCWLVTACCRQKRWPLALAIGCFALQGFFSFSICLVTPMFWAVLGMAASLCGKPVSGKSEVK